MTRLACFWQAAPFPLSRITATQKGDTPMGTHDPDEFSRAFDACTTARSTRTPEGRPAPEAYYTGWLLRDVRDGHGKLEERFGAELDRDTRHFARIYQESVKLLDPKHSYDAPDWFDCPIQSSDLWEIQGMMLDAIRSYPKFNTDPILQAVAQEIEEFRRGVHPGVPECTAEAEEKGRVVVIVNAASPVASPVKEARAEDAPLPSAPMANDTQDLPDDETVMEELKEWIGTKKKIKIKEFRPNLYAFLAEKYPHIAKKDDERFYGRIKRWFKDSHWQKFKAEAKQKYQIDSKPSNLTPRQ